MNCHVFVEGEDDERFVRRVLGEVTRPGVFLKVIRTSNMSRKILRNHVRHVRGGGRGEAKTYFFLIDSDFDRGVKCMTRRKETLSPIEVPADKIFVVVCEIESWYLAGLPQEICEERGITFIQMTEAIAKEKFERMVSGVFNNPLEAKLFILDNYDLDLAMSRNPSLRYLLEKAQHVFKV